MAGHLRQRRAHGQHVVQLPSQGHKIWFTNGSSSGIHAELPEPPDPCREDRQTESAGPDHGHHRRPFHLQADDPGPVRPGNGHRHQHQRVAERPARHHGHGRPQRHGRGSQLCEPRRLLARRRHSGSAYVFQRRRSAHLRQLPHRPGRAAVRHRDHGRAQRHAGERAGDSSSSTRPSGTSDGSSTACSTSPCRASGASRHR